VKGMLRISDAASIGMHAMIYMAAWPGRLLATAEVAEALHVSEAHLSKVLQRLHRVGLVEAVRGPKGGFRLTVAPEECTLLRVFESIEGPLVESTCLLGLPKCDASDCCFGGVLAQVNRIVHEHLASTRLSDVSRIFGRVTGEKR